MSEFRTARGADARRRTRRAWAVAVVAAATAAGAIPIAAASAAPPDAISNGTFTAGLKGWSLKKVSSGQFAGYPKIAIGASTQPSWSWMARCATFQGTRPFLSIDVPGGAVGYVEHQLTVPRSPSKLSFKTWGNLQPTTVTISIVTGTVVHTLLSYSPPPMQGSGPNGCSGGAPVIKSIAVAAFAGKKVGLRVEATSSGTDGTIADFDNFSLTGASSRKPKPKPTPHPKPKSKRHAKPKSKPHPKRKSKSHPKTKTRPHPKHNGKSTLNLRGASSNTLGQLFNWTMSGFAGPANFVKAWETIRGHNGCASTFTAEAARSDTVLFASNPVTPNTHFSQVIHFRANNLLSHNLCAYLIDRRTQKTYAKAVGFWSNHR